MPLAAYSYACFLKSWVGLIAQISMPKIAASLGNDAEDILMGAWMLL